MSYREFVDDTGAPWRVWDTHPVAANMLRSFSPGYAGGWLTFECIAERRRLAPIPQDWEYASREEMVAWCERASRVRGREGAPSANPRGVAGHS